MKFLLGFLIGGLMGMLFLLGTVAAFIGGLVLGWRTFGETDASEDPSPTTEEAQP